MMRPERLRDRIDAVVIGASAGGIEALSLLLPALRPQCRASFLIVVHLPREPPSLLRAIFAPKCALPVHEADDKMPIVPGRVYFAPPDYHLLVDEGPSLALSVDEPVHYSRPSVDVLFESAAALYRERVMGVILTGGNDDGASGLRALAAGGGLTVVQEPASAHSPALPRAAIARGPVDLVLPLDEIREIFGAIG
jgi:two-component system chemotaxis response regulator CheB